MFSTGSRKARAGKQAEKEAGGRTTEGRGGDSHMFQLEVGKVQPSLEHLPGDVLCRLHSENLT